MRFTAIVLCLLCGPVPGPHQYFAIRVVDDQTGRGVPLVELRTVNNIRYYTDSNGYVAFYEPGLMGRTVFFFVSSHGYEFRKDGFGYRGKALRVTEGGSATLRIRRVNIAQRLYRVTGAGIYRDSLLLGKPVPLRRPVLNAQVFGSDSVLTAIYHGRIYWFWGDTNRPSYPLGNFHVPGATSRLPSDGGLDPEVGVDLSYFTGKDGFARPTAQMPGKGPTWLTGLTVLHGHDGTERMFACYAKIKAPMKTYERGLVEFDDKTERFEKVAVFDLDAPLFPRGHPFIRTVAGQSYVYFADPYPLIRVRAEPDHLRRPETYQAFTCLKAGSRLDNPQLDRTADGRLRYSWKTNTPVVGPQQQGRLIRDGHMKRHEALLQLQDRDTGKPVMAHRGSVYWNNWRRRWIMITCESFGTSLLGELWYCEADSPVGPWLYAVKVLTHQKYSFYNPKQHPMFDKDGGRIIFFEGTYTNTFSGNPDRTPRYNYNQVMYKLDLSDRRLALPVPVYRAGDSGPADHFGTAHWPGIAVRPGRIAFFAPDRPAAGTVPVFQTQQEDGSRQLRVGRQPGQQHPAGDKPVFYALPHNAQSRPQPTVPLFEFTHQKSGRRAYSIDPDWTAPGFNRSKKPVCYVWEYPVQGTVLELPEPDP